MEMMKKSLYILLFIVTPVLIYAGADILKLSARSQNGNIVIFWQSSSESNLKNYVVERKTVNGSFIEVGTVLPRADKNYEFVDQTAFKATETLYVYRLKIVDNDGSISYSWEVAVPHNVSSVKRTWGSIKALFR
jgi:hypothetical protein